MLERRLLVLVFAVSPFIACSGPPVTTASAPVPGPATTTETTRPTAGSVATNVPASANRLPNRLSDADYWKLLSDISEPGGYFRIEDNYTSNEMEVGQLYTMLRDANVKGDVYMGVGPEQNFTYIASIRPQMAFIVDIRRQAVVQHLMFKAIFEMAKDRGEFISLLFGKPRPPGIDTVGGIQRIWEAYRLVKSDSALAAQTYARVVERLTKTHGFTLTDEEMGQLRSVFNAFYYWGPSIATRGSSSGGRGGDFSDLTGYSHDASGQPRSFLSSEENYRFLKSMHERNMIVPVSGDFAGPKTIRAIGTYLKSNDAKVRAFYVSNVEQYLFGDGKAATFYANVATLPVDSGSVFIRPYSMRRGFGGGGMTQSLCPIAAFIRSAEAGRIYSNDAALACVP
jgi:hypothetical protein